MLTSIHFSGFISSIYDRHVVEWNRIINQHSNDSTSNNLPMFYHHDFSFDFNQFIIDSIHNTIDQNINYNNPQQCVQFSFELSKNVVQLFNTNSFNIFIHPDYVYPDVHIDDNVDASIGTDTGKKHRHKYSNSSNQLSQYIQDICHKELFLWKNKLSNKPTVINIEDIFDFSLKNILNSSMNQFDNHNILDDNIFDDNNSDTSSEYNSLYMQEQLSVD
jgi:hypothetical protein